jgi:hypothetical protein
MIALAQDGRLLRELLRSTTSTPRRSGHFMSTWGYSWRRPLGGAPADVSGHERSRPFPCVPSRSRCSMAKGDPLAGGLPGEGLVGTARSTRRT